MSSCPVCGLGGSKPQILQVTSASPANEKHTTDLLRCPTCDARYAEPLRIVDYVDVDRHGLKFYLEQGAGIRTMLEPLALLDSRRIRRYLEVGCSFGFVMDYARRMLGWQVRGFDPGFIAASGRQELQLPIENKYFTGLDPGERRADVLFCSEVIEHIAEPAGFLANVRGALGPDGILLLTTPNGDALSPDLPSALLLPLLSPGQHVILYGSRAMTALLRQAGFEYLRIVDAGHQLRVAASTVPFDGSSPHFSQALYQRYLAEAAASHDAASPLGAGLVCRLMKEEVAYGDYAAAQSVYLRLREGYLRHFGIDTEEIDPDELRRLPASSFLEFNESWPCNLAGVWHSRGLIQLLHERQPAQAARSFGAAIQFGAALRQRLQAIGADDPETAVLCQEAQIGRLRALVHCDPSIAVTAWEELAASSSQNNTEVPLERIRRLLFADLAQLGRYALAERVLGSGAVPVAPAGDPDASITDFACALYLLNHAADFAGAAGLLQQLRVGVCGALGSGTDDNHRRELLQQIEIAWLSALTRSDASNAIAALRQISSNQIGLDSEVFLAHQRRVFRQLFVDAATLGHYALAEQTLAASPDADPSAIFEDGEAAFAWGIFLLNHRADYAAAAAVFARAWRQAQAAGIDPVLLWRARFHQGLASRLVGDAATANAIAAEINSPDSRRPPVPDEVRIRASELLTQ